MIDILYRVEPGKTAENTFNLDAKCVSSYSVSLVGSIAVNQSYYVAINGTILLQQHWRPPLHDN